MSDNKFPVFVQVSSGENYTVRFADSKVAVLYDSKDNPRMLLIDEFKECYIAEQDLPFVDNFMYPANWAVQIKDIATNRTMVNVIFNDVRGVADVKFPYSMKRGWDENEYDAPFGLFGDDINVEAMISESEYKFECGLLLIDRTGLLWNVDVVYNRSFTIIRKAVDLTPQQYDPIFEYAQTETKVSITDDNISWFNWMFRPVVMPKRGEFWQRNDLEIVMCINGEGTLRENNDSWTRDMPYTTLTEKGERHHYSYGIISGVYDFNAHGIFHNGERHPYNLRKRVKAYETDTNRTRYLFEGIDD